ncbi:helix-turn-helix domain-containing protein [Thermodesulfovibrio sp. 3462-1]|uniref:Helix-turn-helix domain-containing protein n=1 Tax=Thermodesulfovibrio obliviosus TaxID=3118332 RepID=A0AAU8H2Q6_9BACT
MEEKLLTSQEVAEILGITMHRLYTWTAQGKIPVIKISRKMIRFRWSDIEQWLQEKTVLPQAQCRNTRSVGGKGVDIDRIVENAKKEVGI